jgi:hypothetical protein
MAIQNRRGNAVDFDPNKMLSGEFGYVLTDSVTYKKGLYYCYAPGDVRRLATAEDVQAILNSSESAYLALQQLIADLESNPNELTNMLNNITDLQNGKLDKVGDSKDNTVTFVENTNDEDIVSGENHATLFGKILKSIKTFRDSIGNILNLTTFEKSNLVGAVNEVDDRLATIESQGTYSDTTLHNDYKSIFTTGTGKDNLSADQDFSDIVSGQSNVKLDGLTGNNAVTNGDFSNGTTGWSGLNGTLSAVNNTLSLTGDGTSQSPIIYQNFSNKIINNKFFYMAKVKVTNSNAEYIKLECLNATTTDSTVRIDNPTQNTLYKLYGIFTYNSTSGNFRVREFYADAATANGKVMEVKDAVAIDLTALGLDTLTKEQCDFMYDHYINGLQGVGSGKIVSVGKNLFDKTSTVDKIIQQATSTYASRVVEEGFDCLKFVGNNSYSNKALGIKFKPNTQYTVKFTAKNNGTQGGLFAFLYTDGSMTLLPISGALSSSFTAYTVTSAPNKSVSDLTLSYNATGTNYYRLDNFQLEEGTTATTYEPYQSSELIYTLPQKFYRLPNNIADTMEEVNGVKQVTYQTKEYTLQSGDITALYTSTTNADRVVCSIPVDAKAGTTSINRQTIPLGFTSEVAVGDRDLISSIGSHYYGTSNTDLQLIVAKGTYASLAAAQTALAGTKIIYQLATPVTYKNGENGFSVTGNIEAYPNGTIYQEPVTIKESTNAKIHTTYNLSDKAVTMQNSAEISAINKKMSDWKTVNPWIAPTLLNGWVNTSANHDAAGYYKDEFGIVHLKGVISTGTIGTIAFILPNGFRPEKLYNPFATTANTAYAQLVIENNGNVKPYTGSNVGFSLNGISFKVVN